MIVKEKLKKKFQRSRSLRITCDLKVIGTSKMNLKKHKSWGQKKKVYSP